MMMAAVDSAVHRSSTLNMVLCVCALSYCCLPACLPAASNAPVTMAMGFMPAFSAKVYGMISSASAKALRQGREERVKQGE